MVQYSYIFTDGLPATRQGGLLMGMQYKVPQNIDLEDKVVGPFTMKQFGYMVVAFIIIYPIYKIFGEYENGTVIASIIAVPVGIIAFMLIFLKINDRPFEFFLRNMIAYIFSSKHRIWQNGYVPNKVVIKLPPNQAPPSATLTATRRASLDDIAKKLGVEGGTTPTKPTDSTPRSGVSSSTQSLA